MHPNAVPMWPAFAMERCSDIETVSAVWKAFTCTMRPPVQDGRGQIFAVTVICPSELPQAAAREEARHAMVRAYLRAHPDNCANTPKELLV